MGTRYLPQELIRKKRDGHKLNDAEIAYIVSGICDLNFTDAQTGAFAMAVVIKGLDMDERVSLTKHMMNSGKVLKWDDLNLNGPIVDKHSSGGVGDKVSLMLAPIVAACGAYVPMISGRGLGHTGGTLDKLESIPGYNVMPSEHLFRDTVSDVGCAIIGQTAQLAPADQRLYSIRDVTATIESVGLITASILSKKLAAGLDALVMDVKTGNGAFCKTRDMAREVGRSIVDVASGAGVPTKCLITDMNSVLGNSVGNSVEISECISFLTSPNKANPRLLKLTLELAAHMVQISGIESDLSAAYLKAEIALNSGMAAEIFEKMVLALGGPSDILKNPLIHLTPPPIIQAIPANKSGYISGMDVRKIGLSLVSLKAGRVKSSDTIDHSVGLSEVVQIGQFVSVGDPLAIAQVRNLNDIDFLKNELSQAMNITDEMSSHMSESDIENGLIYDILTPNPS
ncbi:MAG: thymidine phosphorylase [Crocinitomicaceae bacterium]|nr:thymidine phosphorylase [Crocinitomicaceae bacterium]